MDGNTIHLSRDGVVATIALNRPGKRNALDFAMWAQLLEAVEQADADPAVKVIVVTGEGGVFAAGQDIEEFGKAATDPTWAAASADIIYRSQKGLHTAAKPTIAKIRGACIGGGNGIALCCDFRFADTTTLFGITAAKLGIVYPLLDTKRLVDVVGAPRAKDILFTGRTFGAEEALGLGMIDRLVAPEKLDETVAAYAAQLAENSQYSLRAGKRMIQATLGGAAEETPDTRRSFVDAFSGADFKEGQAAFMGKRAPKFTFS